MTPHCAPDNSLVVNIHTYRRKTEVRREQRGQTRRRRRRAEVKEVKKEMKRAEKMKKKKLESA